MTRKPFRFLRKHRLALIFLAAYLFILFFPMLYMGRVLSANDVYYHYGPWSFVRQVEAQNPVLNDPPTAYLPLLSLLKSDPASFHWDRYVASGIPGFGSAAAAVLAPVILVPTLLLPLRFVYLGIIVVKFVVAFVLAYWWLREERLGKHGAAVGAVLFAGAGTYAVWWLWQGTNATVLYPAVLLVLSRMFHGKRNSVAALAVLGVSLFLSGFPATVAYIAYLALLYLLYLSIRERWIPVRELARAGITLLISIGISLPFLVPFFSLIRRSGWFAFREKAGYDFHYPFEHFRAFVNPFRLGDPAAHLWIGDPRLGNSNNYVEATVYVGLAALVLIPLAIFATRAQHRWFWLLALIVLLALMFGEHHPLKDIVGELPGMKYSPLTRLRVLIPLPVAYLAAAAVTQMMALMRRFRLGGWTRQLSAGLVGMFIVADLALFAGRFFPFVSPRLAKVSSTPTIEFLHSQPGPFRIVPFFNYLWPNSAELVRLEDVRSHFGSEQLYRDLLRRFDPESWGGSSTVIQFNSLRTNISDPILPMLNVRYLIEQPNIDIVRWKILEKSTISAQPVGEIRVTPAASLTRAFRVDRDGLYALDLNLGVARKLGNNPRVEIELIRPETGESLFRREWNAERLEKEPKVYVPLWPYAWNGNVVLLRIRAHQMETVIPTTNEPDPVPLLYGRVMTPIIPTREFPDGRVFQNLAELPRHWAVWNIRTLSDRDLMTAADVDFSREAIVRTEPDDSLKNLGKITPWQRRVRMRLLEYSGSRHLLETDSDVPFLLATSEKLTPELRMEIDGRTVRPVQINGLFAGVRVAPGNHRIELTRRIGRGWWLPAIVALAMLGAGSAGRWPAGPRSARPRAGPPPNRRPGRPRST